MNDQLKPGFEAALLGFLSLMVFASIIAVIDTSPRSIDLSIVLLSVIGFIIFISKLINITKGRIR